MIKKVLIKIAVLVPVFVAALLFFNYQFNVKNADVILQMEEPTYPTVSFILGDENVNYTNGYANRMEVPAVRDMVLPTEGRHSVTALVHPYGNKIESVDYRITDLSGLNVFEEGTLEMQSTDSEDIRLDIQLTDVWLNERDAALELKVSRTGKDPVYFYSRITRTAGVNAENALAFCLRYNGLTRDNSQDSIVDAYLETNFDSDNGTLQYVNMHCELNQVMWNRLKLSNVSDVSVRITECNEVYTSLELNYSADITGEYGTQTYDVSEFYRVRPGHTHFYILSFERTANVRYETQTQFVTKTGLDLGITSPGIERTADEEGKFITYITSDALWQYNVGQNTLTKVYSFRKESGNDERDTYRGHRLHILHVDELGNVSFTVSGYMNSDAYEGSCGCGVFFYNAESGTVTTKLYLADSRGAEVAALDVPELLYYSHDSDCTYLIIDDDLIKVNGLTGGTDVIYENMSAMGYAVSDDNRYLAYTQEDGYSDEAVIEDLETGEKKTVNTSDHSGIKILGFIGQDVILGGVNADDKGEDPLGEEILPMYRVEIVTADNKKLKDYQRDGEYILDAGVSGRLITLSLACCADNVYVEDGVDHISLGEEESDKVPMVALETYQNGDLERCVRFAIDKDMPKKQPRVSTARILVNQKYKEIRLEPGTEDEYYLYAGAHLKGVYDNAGEAIRDADELFGVVTSSTGNYIWERGNRDLAYDIQNVQIIVDESSVAACVKMLLDYREISANIVSPMKAGSGIKKVLEEACSEEGKGNVVDLSGAAVEQICYVLDQDCPVIATTGPASAVLLTGYTEEVINFIDPAQGSRGFWTYEQAETILGRAGYGFITVQE